MGGAPAKGQSRCAVDREQSTVEMLSCNKLYPGKCMRPGQDEVIKDHAAEGCFACGWPALLPGKARKGKEPRETKRILTERRGAERKGQERKKEKRNG